MRNKVIQSIRYVSKIAAKAAARMLELSSEKIKTKQQMFDRLLLPMSILKQLKLQINVQMSVRV